MIHRRSRASLCLLLLVLARGPICHAADDVNRLEESWDAVFLGTDKVGYSHTTVDKIRENDRDLIRMRVESVLSIKRFGTSIDQTTDTTSIETPDGKLVRIDVRAKHSAQEQRTRGSIQGNQLRLTVATPGKETTAIIPWGDDVLSPYAEEQLLKNAPLEPGASRTYRSFSADMNQVLTTRLSAEEPEDVTLLDGTKRRLQRIRAQIEGVPALKNMKVYQWVDEHGDVLKEHMDFVLSMTVYRTTKEVAMAKPSTIAGDFGFSSLIGTEKKLPNPYGTTEVVYQIEVTDEQPADVIPQDARQRIAKGAQGEWLLTVRAIDPTKGPGDAATPGGEYLEPNNYIQSDDARVIAAAQRAVADASDPWAMAQRIEKWVYENVKEKNFSLGLATAAEVAQNLEGDCTEHGVLLAAMARAVKIPSRVAVGLVYAERLEKFGYHMWTEVYVHGHWVPVDGTLGRGRASPAHIKIFDSSMAGVDAMATFLPVAAVMNRLKIDVVSWKHGE